MPHSSGGKTGRNRTCPGFTFIRQITRTGTIGGRTKERRFEDLRIVAVGGGLLSDRAFDSHPFDDLEIEE